MNKKSFYAYGLSAVTSLAALLPFASRLLTPSISIDTEQMVNTPQRILTSWLYHERPGLVVTKLLFGQTTFHYGVAVVGAVVFLVLACMLFGWIVNYPTGRQPRGISAETAFSKAASSKNIGKKTLFDWLMPSLLIPALFLTHPIMTEQLHFLLQSMEVAWAILLCVAAASLSAVSLWSLSMSKTNREAKGRSICQAFLAVLLMTWSFSSYQALIALYIAVAAGIYLLQYDHTRTIGDGHRSESDGTQNTGSGSVWTGKAWWRLAISQVLIFAIGFFLSRIAAKVGLYISTGSFQSTAYVAGMVKWGTQPAIQCLKDLYHYGVQIVTGGGIFYTLAYVTALMGTFVTVLCRMKKERHHSGYVAYLLAGVILYVAPFLLALYTGGPDQVRAQMALPFVIAFGWYYLIRLLMNGRTAAGDTEKSNEATKSIERKSRNVVVYAAVIAACLFACVQYAQTARLTYTAYQTYQQECALTRQIAAAVEATGAPTDAKIQFVGRWSPQMTGGMVRGETIGYSFYEWDAEKAYGSTERIIGLWSTLGYDYSTVGLTDASAGCDLAAGMPCWPEDGSVVWTGDRVVVKLSE